MLQNSLLYPSYVAGISVVLLLGQAITTAYRSHVLGSGASGGGTARLPKNISANGGFVIFAFKLSRLVACFALAGLTLPSLKDITSSFRFDISNAVFIQTTICVTFVCIAILLPSLGFKLTEVLPVVTRCMHLYCLC